MATTLVTEAFLDEKIGTVYELSSHAQLENLFKEFANQLVVVNFTSHSSSVCKSFRPVFDNFAQQYPDIKFIRVEMSNLLVTTEKFGISQAPTTEIYLNGQRQTQLLGYCPSQLQQIFEVFSRLIEKSD